MENETQFSAVELRQQEVAQYDANIVMYQTMLQGLPSEWPERLLQYKNVTERHKVIGEIENLDDVELVSDLWTHDDCVKAIRTETLEKRKSQAILSALQAQV